MEEGPANTKPSLQQSVFFLSPTLIYAGDKISQLAGTFLARAFYNDGIAFPNGPGHYIWVPEVAAGPMGQYANTNFQYLDPSFSVTRPYAAGIIGNGHGGQLQTNGFNTHENAAGGFSNASYAVDSGNTFGGQYAANGFDTQMSAAGAFSDASYAVNNGNSYGGFPTQFMAPDANPSGFRAINSGNVYGGQLPANGFDTPLMARDADPSAFRAIDSSPVHAGQFSTSGFQNQQSTTIELPNAPPMINDNAIPLVPAHVGPKLHTCPECKTAFKRKGELKRHAKKHQPDSNVFRCVIAGCGYNSYRKDKLADHVKHRHAVTASAST
ncbi:hypothetical protein BDR22DRAFT_825606 [Usnea florida]